jgi:hypothetical protein
VPVEEVLAMHSSKEAKIQDGPHQVSQSFAELVPLELRPRLFKFSNVITWALRFLYMIFQFNLALSVQIKTPSLLWRMWIVLLAEVALSFQEAVLAVNTPLAQFGVKNIRARSWYRLIGNSAPTVDVFILCCGEPNDVVLGGGWVWGW